MGRMSTWGDFTETELVCRNIYFYFLEMNAYDAPYTGSSMPFRAAKSTGVIEVLTAAQQNVVRRFTIACSRIFY